jgi:hypothetical protein
MVSSKFSRRPRVQQPPPVCKSKKRPKPPLTSLAATRQVHWTWDGTPPIANDATPDSGTTTITLDPTTGIYSGTTKTAIRTYLILLYANQSPRPWDISFEAAFPEDTWLSTAILFPAQTPSDQPAADMSAPIQPPATNIVTIHIDAATTS